jgi:lipid II isoglutaminyl synthase (glutamine-hydrolysing)
MQRAQLSAALMAGRAAATLSRRLGRGGGTVIAGHVVPRIAPSALQQVTRQLSLGSIVVSGTNGKTTTSRLVSHILEVAGYTALHNRAGANLLSGLFAAAAQGTDWRGAPRGQVGVFEVDEATVPAALEHVEPRVLLLLNIFRDQLDRYGEVHFVAGLWRRALAGLGPATCAALNADDPLVAGLAGALAGPEAPRGIAGGRAVLFGLDDPAVGTPTLPHAADARLCPCCGARLAYEVVYYGHLGRYACSACGFSRPRPTVGATRVELRGDAGSRVAITTPVGSLRADVHLPGLYNVYNVLAAVATCVELGIPIEAVARGLETFTAAFGRLERVRVEERELFLALVKNPVGFTEVVRTILEGEPGRRTVVLAINDQFADGTDVSWLWDVDFERLAGRVNVAVCAGLRAEDMAVRLKYAGVEVERLCVEPEPGRALAVARAAAAPGETVYVLPTYTAMLAVRDVLRQEGYVRGFWED